MQDEAVKKARAFLDSSIPYDFSFEHGASSLYCFELAALCYDKLDIPTFNVKKLFGLINKKDIYVAQSFVDSKDLDLIFCFNPKHSIDFRKLGI